MRSRIAVATALVLVATAGCYFRKYDKLARTHVAVLVAMAQKLEDVTRRAGGAPAAMGEYRYPLERAEDFARIAAQRFEGRPSLRAFRELCAAYARMLEAVERVRQASTSARAGGDGGAAAEDAGRT